MGMWVILIGDADFCLDSLKGMGFEGKKAVKDYGGKQFDVIYDEGYVSFQSDYDGMIRQDYAPDEIARLPFEEPRFILMRYSHKELLKSVMGSGDFPSDVLVDCDGADTGLGQVPGRSRLLNGSESQG